MPVHLRKPVYRTIQNACCVCQIACSKSTSLACRNCTELTHALGISMTEEVISKFQQRSMQFFCPNCISTPKNKYNYKKSLESRVVGDNQQQKEEMNKDQTLDETTTTNCQSSGLGADLGNVSDSLSVSVESLEEYAVELATDEENELLPAEHEPEAWSVTVDKKTLKRMSAKNIKRQDHIWELIQTEKSHYRTLKIMQKIFVRGIIDELSMNHEMVYRIFPRLDDLIDIHLTFIHSLIQAQKLSVDKSIEEIGPIVLQQFGGKMGERMKVAYGEFCSRHNEAMQLFKDLLKSDVAFQAFVKKCSRNCLCKRLGIPECILLVTQRMTKYPMLIESIIKTTPETSRDATVLPNCLSAVREILSYIDQQVDEREKEQRLFDLYNRLDARSFAVHNGKKFKKSDLLSNNRKLLHDGHIKWMSARGKPFEVLAVLLSDVIFFLAENGQRCTFFSQDNKTGVISLAKLLIREKGDTRDSKGIYLICQSKTEPEMYEFVCRSVDERHMWIQTIRKAISNCPEEGEQFESEEERKLQEAISVRLRQLIDGLRHKDLAINRHCEEKMAIALEILEMFAKDDISSVTHQMDEMLNSIHKLTPDSLMQALLFEVSKLFALMQPGGVSQNTANVVRSLSNTSRHSSDSSITVQLPKRAGTFSGFEGRNRPKVFHRPSSAVTGSATEEVQNDDDEASSPVSLNQALVDDETNSIQASCSSQGTLILSREQCTCMAKIVQYVHHIVCITARLTTEKEIINTRLSEASFKLARMQTDSERCSHERPDRKSPGYHPDKQLEELRSLQGSIQQQKTDLDRIREHQMALVNQQRDELLHMQQDIDKQKAEIKAQKDELQRQREALQRQVDLFEEQRVRANFASPSTPSRFNSSTKSPLSADVGYHRLPTDDFANNSPGRTRQSSPAADPSCQTADDVDAMTAATTVGRGRTTPAESVRTGQHRVPVVGVTRRDTMPPMHLISAANEARVGIVQVQSQQLPLKLASSASDASYCRSTRSPGNGTPDGGKPRHSSPTTTSGNGFPTNEPTTPSRSISLRLDRDAAEETLAARSSATLPPASARVAGAAYPLASRPVPPRLISAHSSGSILPLKLAERQQQRPKSASSTTSSPVHQHQDDAKFAEQSPSDQDVSIQRSVIVAAFSQQQRNNCASVSGPLTDSSSPDCSVRNVASNTIEKEVIYF